MITDHCVWFDGKPVAAEGHDGGLRMMVPGCKQNESWGRWWFEQFKFCPFCGHPTAERK